MPNQYIWGIIQWNDSESIVRVSAWSNLCLSWPYTSTTNTRDWCLEKEKKMELIAQWVEMVSVGVLRFFYKSSAFPWNIYATKVGKLKKYLVKI